MFEVLKKSNNNPFWVCAWRGDSEFGAKTYIAFNGQLTYTYKIVRG